MIYCLFAIRIRFIEADPDPDPADQNETDPNGSGSATLVLSNFKSNVMDDPYHLMRLKIVRKQIQIQTWKSVFVNDVL